MKVDISKTVSNRTDLDSNNIRTNINFSNIDNQDMTLSRVSQIQIDDRKKVQSLSINSNQSQKNYLKQP